MSRERLVVGIGCTRGTPHAVLAAGVDAVLARHGLTSSAVEALASIDRKRDERGLQALARARGWRLALHDAAALAAISTTGTTRVAQAVGTPSVAEPAALLTAGGTTLLVPKTIHRDEATGHRVTLAIARLGAQP